MLSHYILREQASRLRHCVFTVGALLAGAFGIYGAFINAKFKNLNSQRDSETLRYRG
ncbi:hypothetical protein X564_08375 [Pseudoalteromonas agarivorans]|nr:hypothetical protein X564_08375 [Pseudoalteromonas agarivorans]